MKFAGKKILLQAAVLLAAAGLYGCSGDGKVVSGPESDAGGGQKNQAMGRYVESEIPLPEGVTYDSVVSFQEGPEGKPVLFVRENNNGTAEYTGYLLSEDLTWEERTCGWLNQLALNYEYSRIGIAAGEDQKLYAVYSKETDQERIVRHYVTAADDWENGQQVELSVLTETNELGYAYFPGRVTALRNGNFLFDSGRSLFLFDARGQRKIAEILSDDNTYFAHDNQFYIIDGDSKSLIRYSGEDGTEETRYPLELEEYYGVLAAVNGDGGISLVSKAGIQILKNGSGIWEQIVEGKRNTMGSPKYYPAGFVEGAQQDYFVFYSSMDETCKLSHYVYQPDMPVEPETELTIFSLYDNNTIRQGISEFQIENPNVKIDFQPMMEGSDAAAAEDYIRTLNAELVTGKGPDILILDGMSERSYIEKGVLADLTEEIERLVSSGDYLANIAEGSRVNGKIYSAPVKIGLPMVFGRKTVLKEAGQTSTLADLVQKNEVGQVFGTIDRDKLLSIYADAYMSAIVSEDGAIQEQELKNFLSDMKRVFDGSRISDGTRENRPVSIWGLLEDDIYLYSDEIAGFFESGQGTSIIEQAEGELEADMILLNETYIPYGTVGINKSSANKDLAVQFLLTVLSEDVQRSDFYDGFAVNQNALEFLNGIVRSSADGYGGMIQGTDGRTYEMKISWPSEPLRRQLVELCRSAKYSAGRNGKVKQMILEGTKGYFDGKESLEEAENKLMSKIERYLQE